MNNNNKFRLHSKSLFLTYPKAPLDLNWAIEQLKTTLANHNIEEYALAKEAHKDGSPHVHVWLKLVKKLDTKNPRLLDLIKDGAIYHGEYENAKKDKSSMEYVLKSVNEESTIEILVSQGIKSRLTKEGTIKSIETAMIDLAEDGNINEALELLKKEKPRDYLHKHNMLRKNLTDIALVKSGLAKPKFSLKNYHIEPALQNILDNYKKDKTLILVGEAGTGKTQFLQTFIKEVLNLNPLVINNLDGLRYFKENLHNAILLDDCANLNDKSREEVIKLIDSEGPTTHNIKHGSVMINKATPRFVVLNPPIPSALANDDPAILRRYVTHTLVDSLIPKKP